MAAQATNRLGKMLVDAGLIDESLEAELDPEEKNAVSHRGQAMREAIEIIRERLSLLPDPAEVS